MERRMKKLSPGSVGLLLLWILVSISLVASVSYANDADATVDSSIEIDDKETVGGGEAGDEEVALVGERNTGPDDTAPDQLHLVRRLWKSQPVVSLDDLIEKQSSGVGGGWYNNPLKNMVAEASPANMAVLFVSNSEGCRQMAKIFEALARAYWEDLEKRRSVSTSKLFFFVANLTRGTSKSLFREHKITKVPTLALIPLGVPYPSRDFAEDLVMDPSFGTTVKDMGTWIENHAATGFKFSPTALAGNNAAAAFAGSFTSAIENWGLYLIAFQILILFISNAYRFTTKVAWMSLSIGVYFFSVSGMIFCLLRGVAPFGYSEQHGFMFIYPDRSGQFFLEGIVIGLLNCMISMVFVIAGDMNNGKDAIADMETWFDGEPPERIIEEERYGNNPLIKQQRVQRLLKTAGICVGVGMVLTFNLMVLFKRKAPWYRPFSF